MCLCVLVCGNSTSSLETENVENGGWIGVSVCSGRGSRHTMLVLRHYNTSVLHCLMLSLHDL